MGGSKSNIWGGSTTDQSWSRSEKGRKRVLPAELIRKNAMESSDGGRAYCDFCRHAFSANYVGPVMFHMVQRSACRDCRKALNLSLAR